ncbi:protein export chaperone SatS [Candidatus Mycobacterium methanotrophicum]|uniref:Primosomal protein n=1 Tax=Candidatus Mycobacterium methanotrophicum TaxID=2943498 RepID=A0ABY4QMT5_9MYCO|nr:primosomal protein [Candidatus Mycobacterium methanotrophicum]UQX12327.1 primosomal protein [Candidatus Mycobacterium methanotrophicum]
MAADLVPIRLSLTGGDRYTVWAPRWRDAGDEWEAFLGKDEDLYGFETAADLVAFVRTNTDNDLVDHPQWQRLSEANAHKLEPAEDKQFDLIAVEELVAEKPTEESVTALANALAIVSSIGSVCELPAVMKFFNGNPTLGTLAGGIGHFTGKAGLKRWHAIAEVIGRGWDDVLAAVDEIISAPDVDSAVSEAAAAELAEPLEQEPLEKQHTDEQQGEPTDDGAAGDVDPASAPASDAVLGGDEDFWAKVGIDPIRVMIGGRTYYTLRCYFDDRPIFLGRNGRISVFASQRALARYLADERDHDLADLSTYDDVRTAATDGSLRIDVTHDNGYVLTGLVDDLAAGPDSVDREQLDLAVELLRDVGDYAEDNTADKALATERPLGQLVAYVLEPDSVSKPAPPYAEAVEAWEELERFVESRLRPE